MTRNYILETNMKREGFFLSEEKLEYRGILSDEELRKVAGGTAPGNTGAECIYCQGNNTERVNLEGMGWTWICWDCNKYWQE